MLKAPPVSQFLSQADLSGSRLQEHERVCRCEPVIAVHIAPSSSTLMPSPSVLLLRDIGQVPHTMPAPIRNPD